MVRGGPRKAKAAVRNIKDKIKDKIVDGDTSESEAALEVKGKQSAKSKDSRPAKAETATAAATAAAKDKSKQPVKKAGSKRKAPVDDEDDEDDSDNDSSVGKSQPTKSIAAPKKRKIKAKEQDSMPLAPRTAVSSLKQAMHIGAHVSGAGGVQNAVTNAAHIGANAFALFLKSQRKWANPPLGEDARAAFAAGCAAHAFDAGRHVVPHGSYLVNLAQADEAKAAQAYDSFVDDLRRCDALGVALYNLHPGNTGGAPRAAALARIAAALDRAHAETGAVVTLLENMAGGGNVVGSAWEDLRDIIALVRDKARVGVCLDTCHAFAAGHDLRTPAAFAATMRRFDDVVGLRYLRALHLNDSKAPLGSRRDLHANIGTGFLGLRAFHSVVNYAPFAGLPMVLETPIDRAGADGKTVEDKQVWADEIKLLESLVGMDPDGDEFRAKEAELQAAGAEERRKHQDQADRKAEKDAKKAEKDSKKANGKAPAKRKGRKKAETSEDEESE